MARQVNPRELQHQIVLFETDATGKSDWLQIGGFPVSTLHTLVAAGTPTFTVDVEVANVEADDAAIVHAADVAAKALTALPACAFVRVHVKTLTGGGRLKFVWNGASQSGGS